MPRDERPLEADLTTASVPAVVQDGSLELLGLLPNSSNGTFLARVSSPDGEEALVVYKPLRGESPLWDFPEGSLGRREVAASLVATTLNADAQQFMAGRLRLSGDPAGTASVVNEGRISTPAGGHVVLAAAQVDNRGHITTPHGTTALAAGSAVEIDPTGAGLLRIRIPTGALQAHLAQVTVRQNEDVRRISAWAAILGIPTAVAGIYGMNFEHMPELEWSFGYPLVLVLMGAACTYLYHRLRRAGWL